MSEILYDLQNKTYLTGRSMAGADGARDEAVAALQANEDDENKNQLLRSMQEAYGTLRTRLSEYLEESGTTATNELIAANNFTIALKMPSNYNLATKETIASTCNKFITNSALADWYNITYPDKAANYLALAKAAVAELIEAMSKRNRPTRTAPTPAGSGSGA